MTASPIKVNGTAGPAVPILGPWEMFPIVLNGVMQDEAASETAAAPVPVVDPRTEAEAAAIRARTATEVESARIKAQAEADATRTKAEAEAERLRLANERNRMALEEKQTAHARKIAELQAEQEEIERQAAAARKKAEDEAQAAAEEQREQRETADKVAKEIAVADARWRRYALGFYIVCAVVALPVQVAAFWNPVAPWLVIAPLMLEGGAAVVLKGAAAAVAGHRPHWHYRLIAWLLAFIAAGVNLWHGLNAFDPATAIGTAFASVAGPGVWDLHEHGRIRKRDGVLTRRERKAKEKAEARAAAEEAAERKAADAAKAADLKAAEEAANRLATDRAKEFKKVWEHALKLAAALGETTVTEAVWIRAYRDIEGTEPGDSVDVIRTRNVAARRVAAARSEAPGNTPSKVTNAQRVPHLPPGSGRGSKTGPKVRGIRRQGDAPKFTPIARKQAAFTAKQSTANPSKESSR